MQVLRLGFTCRLPIVLLSRCARNIIQAGPYDDDELKPRARLDFIQATDVAKRCPMEREDS